ncbi:cyclic nucleotide-binding domain-containing protein [Dethiosulfatarculus sandiegensis]|uniref:Cyclic nucleotide-binding domain-containing protein n=1 Tax=Dethiosulfatarculus sandiegensis TaxID=1429043 RepID=A0A0D2HML2_9BACT|nr:cyclic nucleotide-binding domain-containing protein [Dethiosulfatarculus sandiegensis]KIX11838.1 hypothetical protein X474_22440 [Dethiosulfatarculus sandiegensis]
MFFGKGAGRLRITALVLAGLWLLGAASLCLAASKEEVLAQSDIFSGLTDRQLDLLASISKEELVPAGNKLTTFGEPVEELLVIASGTVKVILPSGNVVAMVGPGTTLGEMGFVDKKNASASLVTQAECRVLKLKASELRSILNDNPLLGYKVMEKIAAKISRSLRARNGV